MLKGVELALQILPIRPRYYESLKIICHNYITSKSSYEDQNVFNQLVSDAQDLIVMRLINDNIDNWRWKNGRVGTECLDLGPIVPTAHGQKVLRTKNYFTYSLPRCLAITMILAALVAWSIFG